MLGGLALGLIDEVDRGAVLRAHVVALAQFSALQKHPIPTIAC